MKNITPEKPGTELASFLEKNPDAFGNVWECHFWKNYSKKAFSGTNEKTVDFFPKLTLAQFPVFGFFP